MSDYYYCDNVYLLFQSAARLKAGHVRPVLRQRPAGDTVSPIREGRPEDDDKPERRRRTSSSTKPSQVS